ncbi:hypothetical protein TELCIR_01938 [Teladorsagia circumcincta]|uniref:Uncharacterized protein n=1 Tax=Teladorsagia circumcincta TaxID=45464 RepID=A0A2G9V0H5_TELCI|nr:hypothetical protein TELCIR_01938 [Teladorsagia circumcincta]
MHYAKVFDVHVQTVNIDLLQEVPCCAVPGGSSMLEAKPQCPEEEVKPKSKLGRKNRCFGKRRLRFLRRLLSAIKTEMIMTVIQKTPALRPDQLNPFLYILKAD